MRHSVRKVLAMLLLAALLLTPALALAERHVKYTYKKVDSTKHEIFREWDIYTYTNVFVSHEKVSQGYENHTLNGSGKCTKCGAQVGCPHSKTTQISSDVKLLPVNSKYHSTSGTIRVRCDSCKKEFTRNVDGKNEAHNFVGGKCECGFTLSGGKPTATTKPCSHTFRDKVLSAQYKKRDKTYHTAIEVVQHKCSKCGYAKTEEVSRAAAHTIKDGKCADCGEQIACTHAKTRTDMAVVAAVDQRDGTHALQRMATKTCADCGLIVSTEMTSTTQPHTFVGSACRACGAPMQPLTVGEVWSFEAFTWAELVTAEILSFEILETGGGGNSVRVGGNASNTVEAPAVTGYVFPQLDHPFIVDGVSILREGESAELYVVQANAEEGQEAADAETSATAKQVTPDMAEDMTLAKLSADLFPGWTAEGDVSVEEGVVTGGQPGAGSVTMAGENEYGLVPLMETLDIKVVPGDDPSLLFIADESFGQGMLPLLEAEDGTLLLSLEGLYYNPELKCLCGYVVSRLPLSLALGLYFGMEDLVSGEIGTDASWQGVGTDALFGKDTGIVDLSAPGYPAWEEGFAGIGMPLSVPLEHVQAFKIMLPWRTVISQSETLLNIGGTLFTAIPEVKALLEKHGLDAKSITDTKTASTILYEMLAGYFGEESLTAEDSPVRVALRDFYQADEAKLTEALASPENARQLQTAVAAKTPAARFEQFNRVLSGLTGFDALSILWEARTPASEAFWQDVETLPEFSEDGIPMTPEEIDAVLTAFATARAVDATWGMDDLLTGYVGLEIYDPEAIRIE